ncbi:WD domain protein [Aspergillus saccharolyticus JOP 1030-1]|uniref:Probable E3 ubiquitin ligase complex SCF subunit sconB n=1 Tax=Aspergillus saccharolyticus JOP 1030-1 TaxID=1450539 RepID=A0A318ZLN9_9EURO|nr:WD domain protein [Aspergillus saccharolyticus JOP 1030-1]PYH41168.1 WD domain protein [Aspergillus saccharolyticus JOP 1030-1]
MPKRRHEDLSATFPPLKRGHFISIISCLSDELLLHILSFLPINSLIVCQQLSCRFKALAEDSEIWKRHYYNRWIRPRLANMRRTMLSRPEVHYSPKVSTWLDNGHLANDGRTLNWKDQYRLRHNWSRGICRVTTVELSQPSARPALVAFCAGIIFTFDWDCRLRARSIMNSACYLSEISLPENRLHSALPTTLTAMKGPLPNRIEVAVGFEDGYFVSYDFDMVSSPLEFRTSCAGSTSAGITAMASCYPYILLTSDQKLLSLFNIIKGCDARGHLLPGKPVLLSCLEADSTFKPMSISVRSAGSDIISSIVYSFYHVGCGWSLGIQELHFSSTDSRQKDSRLTTTVDSQYGLSPPLGHGYPSKGNAWRETNSKTGSCTRPAEPSIYHREAPTSVSYSHPYLITSHTDNTLTVYLVVSSSAGLYIKGAQRLWGHTSSVSAVQVSDRGKAISVSSRGDEVRVWDLEDLVSAFGKQRVRRHGMSIRVSPGNRQSDNDKPRPNFPESNGLSKSIEVQRHVPDISGCIGFDAQCVLLLRGKEHDGQMLECYDFT